MASNNKPVPQEGCGHLVKKIFPEIRSLCRARGTTVTNVDLRWRLTGEDIDIGQVTRICLDKVDNCRPYNLLADRDRQMDFARA